MTRHLLGGLLLVISLNACEQGAKRLPQAAGAQGEILVVMDKGHWEGPPGEAVRNVLSGPLPRMPRPEPRFRVAQCAHAHLGDMLRTHRNLFIADIGTQDSSGTWSGADLFARGQHYVRVAEPDPMRWIARFKASAEAIAQEFDDAERTRLMARTNADADPALVSAVEAAHGLHLPIPQGFRVMRSEGGATWMQRDRAMAGGGMEHDVIEGLLVYSFPYTSTQTFTPTFLSHARDSLTRWLVPGPDPGSYMVVQRAFDQIDLMPIGRDVVLQGRFAYELNGLFGMEGAKMGGPFIQLATVDDVNGRVVCVDAYVYAPQFDKREFIRVLEAVLYSLRLPERGS